MSPDCKWLTEEEVYGTIDKIIADYEASRTGLPQENSKTKGAENETPRPLHLAKPATRPLLKTLRG